MVKNIWCISFLLVAYAAQAQFNIVPIESTSEAAARQVNASFDTTLTLPFWDDFSTSFGAPDSLRWMKGSHVWVNSTLGTNPPTYRVATFDGLMANGMGYNLDNTFSAANDSLISQPIDLSTVPDFNQNSVYLSFFWQAGGEGEAPDDSDSLQLQFLNSDSLWVTVWSVAGSENLPTDQFFQEIIPVRNPDFFHPNFRMKFVAFSSQRGPFDTWNLDYVYLNQNRNLDDRYHFDRSLTGNPGPLFAPYAIVPAQRFLRSPLTGQQTLGANNLDNQPHPLVYTFELKNERSGETYFTAEYDEPGIIASLGSETISGPESIDLGAAPLEEDSIVLSGTFYWQTGDTLLFETVDGERVYADDILLTVNDTIRTTYTLQDYYAYDDGTAEFAVALNLLRGQLAVMFALDGQDTLTFIDLYFPNIAPESTGRTIDLLVWSDLDNPELIRQPYTIQAPEGLNAFTRIRLSRPLLVRDTLYVGFQQFTDNYIGVGFDRSNPEAGSRIHFNVSGIWEQNQTLNGALMIRAGFGGDSVFVLSQKPELPSLSVYPNPSRGLIRLNGHFDYLEILDLAGRSWLQSAFREELDISFLADGLYLVKIHQGTTVTTRKLILKK